MRLALVALLALTSCGYYDAREARDPRGVLIGQSLPDILSAMGKPDSVMQTSPDTAIIEYVHKDTSTGLKASVSLLGSIQLGGGGGCNVVFTVLRDGTVADATFPQAYSNSLFSTPDESCSPLVSEALHHPSSTSLTPGYSAFDYILPTEKKP